MIIWNEFAAEIYQNAVDHGWWEEERSFGEIVALCHSELSEALEEYRANRPLAYVLDYEGPAYVTDLKKFEGHKPEGIAVELADCVIRILDWLGRYTADIPRLFDKALRLDLNQFESPTFGEMICGLHHLLSSAWGASRSSSLAFAEVKFAGVILVIMEWAEINSVNMEEIIRIKHAYNKGRPYRHGGKLL